MKKPLLLTTFQGAERLTQRDYSMVLTLLRSPLSNERRYWLQSRGKKNLTFICGKKVEDRFSGDVSVTLERVTIPIAEVEDYIRNSK